MPRLIALTLTLFLLSGCKLAVMVVEGGEVQSLASGTCVPPVPGVTGTVCIHEVADTTYTESFTAVPDTGWEFVKWNSGDDFLCKNSTNPTCVVDNTLVAGLAAAEAIVASDKAYYIMPVFIEVGLPITDTVTVDGKEWAQVNIFENLVTWNDINEVCSSGPCDGILAGYDMSDWHWASVDEMNQLFNFYIGSNELGPGPDTYFELGSTWGPAFFSDGWIPTSGDGALLDGIGGITRSCADATNCYIASLTDYHISAEDIARTAGTTPKSQMNVNVGAWFYRTP